MQPDERRSSASDVLRQARIAHVKSVAFYGNTNQVVINHMRKQRRTSMVKLQFGDAAPNTLGPYAYESGDEDADLYDMASAMAAAEETGAASTSAAAAAGDSHSTAPAAAEYDGDGISSSGDDAGDSGSGSEGAGGSECEEGGSGSGGEGEEEAEQGAHVVHQGRAGGGAGGGEVRAAACPAGGGMGAREAPGPLPAAAPPGHGCEGAAAAAMPPRCTRASGAGGGGGGGGSGGQPLSAAQLWAAVTGTGARAAREPPSDCRAPDPVWAAGVDLASAPHQPPTPPALRPHNSGDVPAPAPAPPPELASPGAPASAASRPVPLPLPAPRRPGPATRLPLPSGFPLPHTAPSRAWTLPEAHEAAAGDAWRRHSPARSPPAGGGAAAWHDRLLLGAGLAAQQVQPHAGRSCPGLGPAAPARPSQPQALSPCASAAPSPPHSPALPPRAAPPGLSTPAGGGGGAPAPPGPGPSPCQPRLRGNTPPRRPAPPPLALSHPHLHHPFTRPSSISFPLPPPLSLGPSTAGPPSPGPAGAGGAVSPAAPAPDSPMGQLSLLPAASHLVPQPVHAGTALLSGGGIGFSNTVLCGLGSPGTTSTSGGGGGNASKAAARASAAWLSHGSGHRAAWADGGSSPTRRASVHSGGGGAFPAASSAPATALAVLPLPRHRAPPMAFSPEGTEAAAAPTADADVACPTGSAPARPEPGESAEPAEPAIFSGLAGAESVTAIASQMAARDVAAQQQPPPPPRAAPHKLGGTTPAGVRHLRPAPHAAAAAGPAPGRAGRAAAASDSGCGGDGFGAARGEAGADAPGLRSSLAMPAVTAAPGPGSGGLGALQGRAAAEAGDGAARGRGGLHRRSMPHGSVLLKDASGDITDAPAPGAAQRSSARAATATAAAATAAAATGSSAPLPSPAQQLPLAPPPARPDASPLRAPRFATAQRATPGDAGDAPGPGPRGSGPGPGPGGPGGGSPRPGAATAARPEAAAPAAQLHIAPLGAPPAAGCARGATGHSPTPPCAEGDDGGGDGGGGGGAGGAQPPAPCPPPPSVPAAAGPGVEGCGEDRHSAPQRSPRGALKPLVGAPASPLYGGGLTEPASGPPAVQPPQSSPRAQTPRASRTEPEREPQCPPPLVERLLTLPPVLQRRMLQAPLAPSPPAEAPTHGSLPLPPPPPLSPTPRSPRGRHIATEPASAAAPYKAGQESAAVVAAALAAAQPLAAPDAGARGEPGAVQRALWRQRLPSLSLAASGAPLPGAASSSSALASERTSRTSTSHRVALGSTVADAPVLALAAAKAAGATEAEVEAEQLSPNSVLRGCGAADRAGAAALPSTRPADLIASGGGDACVLSVPAAVGPAAPPGRPRQHGPVGHAQGACEHAGVAGVEGATDGVAHLFLEPSSPTTEGGGAGWAEATLAGYMDEIEGPDGPALGHAAEAGVAAAREEGCRGPPSEPPAPPQQGPQTAAPAPAPEPEPEPEGPGAEGQAAARPAVPLTHGSVGLASQRPRVQFGRAWESGEAGEVGAGGVEGVAEPLARAPRAAALPLLQRVKRALSITRRTTCDI